ncbi:hypothetical protein D3C84_1110970 [compost metagenome]
MRSTRIWYSFTISFCFSMDGIGNSVSHISPQSKISLALPCDLKRAYLSNSGRRNHIIKYSGNNSFLSITSKGVYAWETSILSKFSFNAIAILSPRLDVSAMYVN